MGLILADQGRVVLKASRASSDIVERYLTGHSGLVRVGGTPIFMGGVISPMIAMFQQQIPDVRVDPSYGYAAELTEKLRTCTLDLAI